MGLRGSFSVLTRLFGGRVPAYRRSTIYPEILANGVKYLRDRLSYLLDINTKYSIIKFMAIPKYPFEIRPLNEEEGGGYLITFPDLPGCMSDGATIEEAVANGADAEAAWLQAAQKWGDPIPKPGEGQSGKFVQRLPKSLHARLAARAKQEGVSMNTLVTAVLAEALGRKEGVKRRMKKAETSD